MLLIPVLFATRSLKGEAQFIAILAKAKNKASSHSLENSLNLDKRTENSDKGIGVVVSPHLFDLFLLPHELFHYKRKKILNFNMYCFIYYIEIKLNINKPHP